MTANQNPLLVIPRVSWGVGERPQGSGARHQKERRGTWIGPWMLEGCGGIESCLWTLS